MMAIPWSQVDENPEFQALPLEQKMAIQEQYFNQNIAPNVDDPIEAKYQFLNAFQYATGQYRPPENAWTEAEKVGGPASNLPWEVALMASVGKGTTDLLRGVGLQGPPSRAEEEVWSELKEDKPIISAAGRIAGQALPFVPLAPSAAMALPTRMLAGGTLGAVEGGVVASGTGADMGEIGSAAKFGAAIGSGVEVISTLATNIYKAIKGFDPSTALVMPDGTPTPEMQQILSDTGLKWEDMKVTAQDIVAQNNLADPQQVARMAGFNQIGAPATQGQITKDFAQRKMEEGLMESASEQVATPIRSLQLEQSGAFRNELQSLIDTNGIPPETGESIKGALTARRGTLKAERKAAYDALKTATTNADWVPIQPHSLLDAVPDKGTIRDISALAPGQSKALDDLLVEFGITQSDEAIEAALARGIEIDPLSLNNFESFRKRLGIIERSDQTGAINVITGPLKRALDDEIDLAVEALELSPSEDVAALAKNARQTHRALKTEFDDKKITSKLIDAVKRGSTQPKIEASQAYRKLMAVGAPVENLERVMTSLKTSPAGKKAIGNMQGQAVLDLMDSAFQAQSRQVEGVRIFGATPFSKQYEKLLPKLEILFKDNPADFARLKNVYQRAQDIIPPSGAQPKGSAGFFIDALNKAGVYSIATKVPGAGVLMEMYRGAAESAAKRRQVEKAIRNSPELRAANEILRSGYPQIAAIFGIAAISDQKQEVKVEFPNQK